MIFINKSHENRYFYAFVNEINYINDVTTEIVFELDYSDSKMVNLAFSLAFESLYGDECEPLYMDVSKITKKENFHLHFVAPIKINNRFRMFDWGFLSQKQF